MDPGSVENEVEVWEHFALVGCLVIDEGTLRHGLTARTTHPFGKDPAVLEQVLTWNQDPEGRYRSYGAMIIDATRPLEDVLALGL